MARTSYWTLLRRPPTFLLWLGQFVSTAGDWLYLMAAAWLTYTITGSPAAMSAVAIAAVVPSLVVGFVGGTLLDRWPLLRTLVLLDLVRGGLVALLPALYYLDLLSPWVLAVFGLVLGALYSLFWPALQATLPGLVRGPDELRAINGLVDFTNRLGRVAGPGLTALTAFIPLVHFFSLDAATFLFSAGAFALILRRRPPAAAARPRERRPITVADLLLGWRFAIGDRVLRTVLAVRGLNNFFWAFYVIAAPVLVDRRFGTTIGGWGLIIVAYSLGQLTSNLVVGNRAGGRPLPALFLGWVVAGLGFIGLGLAPSLELGLPAIFVSGLGGPIAHITTDTYMAATTAPDCLARVFALQRTAMDVATAAGMVACGGILALIAPQVALVLAGTGIVTFTLVAATASGRAPVPTIEGGV
jgi:MFS family permease